MTSPTAATWRSRADQLHFETRPFIANDYVEPISAASFVAHSPVSGLSLGELPSCGTLDVNAAVTAARDILRTGGWADAGPARRKKTLQALADGLIAVRQDLAALITLEMGKPITDAVAEIDVAARCLRFYAEAVDKVFGEIPPTSADAVALVTREPLGVVGAVIPWNYPILMAIWKVAPALAAGNAVILKPAEQASLSVLSLGALAREADMPPGILNILPGLGPETGQAIGLHEDIDVVAFTGSTSVGKLFLRYASESNMKSVSLECGGKSPNVVLADAPDLDRAAEVITEGIFVNAGEMCNAGSRVIAETSIVDRLVERLIEASEKWQAKDPFDPATKMGALVSEEHLEKVLEYVEVGKTEGAEVVTGGQRVHPAPDGCYVDPTILVRVENSMRVAREEIFGPVLSVMTCANAEDGLRLANDSSYGLAAGVWTRDISRAHRLARRLNAGNVYVNCYDRSDNTMPFGGYKQSGIGVDKSIHAMHKYTRLKSTWIHLEPESDVWER